MGWKASVIIVHKPAEVNKENLLKELGFENVTKLQKEAFDAALYPDEDKVYLGSYKDNLLICMADLPMQFIEETDTRVETTLHRFFPDSEICATVLHSVVNLWGYAVSVNGKKIRARAGSADNGTFIDTGEPLEEEKELLSKSKIDEKGNRVYILDDFPDDQFSEDQVGENFVFSMFKRYTGEELDQSDDLLEALLDEYSFGKVKKTIDIPKQEQQTVFESRSWWKQFFKK